MNSEQELLQRYGKTALLLDAAEKVIVSPIKSTATYLAEGNSESRNLAKALVAGGASISAAGAALIGMAPIVGGSALGAGAVVGALGGPITWVIVGGGAIIGWITRRVLKKRKEKKESVEKEQLLKRIIAKQQAVIEKLKKQNQQNTEEIRNLKELLKMLNDAETQVRNDFAMA